MKIKIAELFDLDLRARGVLLTLLFLCDDEGECKIQVRSFAKENNLTHQQIRTILSKLESTQWITQLSTQKATHLTLNKSEFKEVLKNIQQHNEQHNKKHIKQPIETIEEKVVVEISQAEVTEEKIDWKSFVSYFNERVKQTKIPQIRVMTEGRKKQIRGLLTRYTKKDLVRAIDVCVNTPFLRGENNRGWTVDIDWIYTEKHFVKIMEGNYEWKGINDTTGDSSGRCQGRGATIEGVAREILLNCKNRRT